MFIENVPYLCAVLAQIIGSFIVQETMFMLQYRTVSGHWEKSCSRLALRTPVIVHEAEAMNLLHTRVELRKRSRLAGSIDE